MLRKNKTCILIFLFLSLNSFSQKNLYAGIEIGRRAIKVSVLDVNNIKKADYKILFFWTEKINFAEHVEKNGELTQEDIDKANIIVIDQLKIIRKKYQMPEENIFIVAAPVFASARNIDVLRNKITTQTNKDVEILSANDEAKTLVKGAIPPVDYPKAFHLDIGAQTTRGGYIDELENDKLAFIPLELNFGTMTLTEAVQKKVANQTQVNDMSVYLEKSLDFNSVLLKKVNEMFDKNPALSKKDKIYLSGGAVWAFATLYYNENVKEHYVALNKEDVINYDAILKNNFIKFTNFAKTNKEALEVLTTYDQKYLISANNILLSCLESIPDIDKKKIYYVKEGQIIWLISYIADRSKKVSIKF